MRPESVLTPVVVGCLLLINSCGPHPDVSDEEAPSGPGTTKNEEEALSFPQYEQWPFDDAEAKRRQEETAARLGISVEQSLHLGDNVYLELILIPAGRLVMGFEGCLGNEPREVAISKPFYIGKLELTWRQYAVFRQKKGAHLTNMGLDDRLYQGRHRLDYALDGISWVTGNSYCKAASKALGCTIRLPSESEWEYACRAGTTGRHIWDDTLRVGDATASCLDDIDGDLRACRKGGQCRPNPWGVYDMIGNVSEWVYDKYREDRRVRAVRDSSHGEEGVAARKPELDIESTAGLRVAIDIDRALLRVLKKNQPVIQRERMRSEAEPAVGPEGEDARAAIRRLGGIIADGPKMEVCFSYATVPDAGLVHLQGLTKLEVLWLEHTRISNAGLEHLQGLTDLKRLYLCFTPIGDAGLQHLQGLGNLEVLFLTGTQVTDAGLRHLQTLTKIDVLGLGGTKVSDAGLPYVNRLTNLHLLDLSRTRVSDAGLVHLLRLDRLDDLELRDTRITDSGVEHLQSLTKLKWLDLKRTQVSNDGAEKLQRALPKCMINR